MIHAVCFPQFSIANTVQAPQLTHRIETHFPQIHAPVNTLVKQTGVVHKTIVTQRIRHNMRRVQHIRVGGASYTCVGRLDQFPSGRGQVFRDMVESERFETTTVEHKMTHNVTMVQTDNIPEFVAKVVAKHDTVQCFADEHFQCPLDTKRIQLFNPLRIRTLRDNTDGTDPLLPGIPMVEEFFINTETCTTLNKSVIPVYGFNGVHVHAAVYICSEDTTPFQIRVAQTHAREALYVVNCQTNLFLLTKKCKKRITISFFSQAVTYN